MLVDSDEIVGQASLLLIHDEEPLGCKSWCKEERERPRGQLSICDRQDRDQRGVESDEPQAHRNKCPDSFRPSSVASQFVDRRRERDIESFGCESCGDSCCCNTTDDRRRNHAGANCREPCGSCSDRSAGCVSDPACIRTTGVAQHRCRPNDHRSEGPEQDRGKDRRQKRNRSLGRSVQPDSRAFGERCHAGESKNSPGCANTVAGEKKRQTDAYP